MNHSKSSATLAPAGIGISTNPEPVSEIIPRTKAGKAIVGQLIKCRYCHEKEGQVCLEDRNYMVRCSRCEAVYYLREQHLSTVHL